MTPGNAESKVGRQAAHRFNNNLRYSDGTDMRHRQLTPAYVLHPVRVALGGIGLDPCTEADNPTGAARFYTVDHDGLAQPWHGEDWLPTVYVNPPYTKAREPWVERCVEAGERGQRVVLLIPAATDTRIFQRALSTASTAVFIKGRVKFGVLRENRRQEAASHPSALIGWNVDLRAACARLGLVVDLRTAEHRLPYDGPLAHDAPQMYAARVLCPAIPPCSSCVDRVLDGVAEGQASTLIAEIERVTDA